MDKGAKGAVRRTRFGLGLLVAAVLLVGCESQPADPERVRAGDGLSSGEIAEVHQNLAGICRAINQYGMDLDRDVRSWVRSQIAPLGNQVGSTASPRTDQIESALLDLADRYRSCGPELAHEIMGQVGPRG